MKPDTSQTLPPGLYIVATPIGNLGDITLRALETLKHADLIACEDTRVSSKLLSHYGIHQKLISLHDHNESDRVDLILSHLASGKRVALISDAGTPLISDPGYKLVRAAQEAGHHITSLPGASSVVTALSLSGLPTDQFLFGGFLPAKSNACKKALERYASIPATLVFFESARRLTDSLQQMSEILGEREAAVVREISKIYEEVRRGSLAELCAYYTQHGEPKGEIVIVIAPPEEIESLSDEALEALLRRLLKTHSVKEAAAMAAEAAGIPRKQAYSLALSIYGQNRS